VVGSGVLAFLVWFFVARELLLAFSFAVPAVVIACRRGKQPPDHQRTWAMVQTWLLLGVE
jgi:hypothetical protein